MYKSIKKKFKILKEILKHKNKYIKNLFYIKYKIKISYNSFRKNYDLYAEIPQ